MPFLGTWDPPTGFVIFFIFSLKFYIRKLTLVTIKSETLEILGTRFSSFFIYLLLPWSLLLCHWYSISSTFFIFLLCFCICMLCHLCFPRFFVWLFIYASPIYAFVVVFTWLFVVLKLNFHLRRNLIFFLKKVGIIR